MVAANRPRDEHFVSAAENHVVAVSCRCGQTHVDVIGRPIIGVVCACQSCRTAGEALQQAAGAPRVLRPDGGTDYVLYRKDRMRIRAGALLQAHRLNPQSKTRRVVSTCCYTPLFVDFTPGHWVTVYRDRLPEPRPLLAMRTMAADAPAGVPYEDDIPTHAKHSPEFMGRLLWAWVGMGFRRPPLVW